MVMPITAVPLFLFRIFGIRVFGLKFTIGLREVLS